MLNLVPDDGVLADGVTHTVDGGGVDFLFIGKLFHEPCIAGIRFLAEQAGDYGAVSSMPLAGAAQAAIKSGLNFLGLDHFLFRELGYLLSEISGDPERGDSMGTGRTRSDLEKIAQ